MSFMKSKKKKVVLSAFKILKVYFSLILQLIKQYFVAKVEIFIILFPFELITMYSYLMLCMLK